MSRVHCIALGAYGPAKTNAARHCTTSNTLCIKSTNHNRANNIATVGVFLNTEDAEAVSRFVLDPTNSDLQSAWTTWRRPWRDVDRPQPAQGRGEWERR